MSTILEEAEKLVGGDRQQDYGDTRKSFTRIARLWSSYKGIEFTPQDVGLMMILLKVSRGAEGAKRDTIVDIAGYARCIEMLGEKRDDEKRGDDKEELKCTCSTDVEPLKCKKCNAEWNRAIDWAFANPAEFAALRESVREKSKEWKLPAPPPGKQWHRDDWTQDMLPEGWRPLLMDEVWEQGDQIYRQNGWETAGNKLTDAIGILCCKMTQPCRTQRPLPTE